MQESFGMLLGLIPGEYDKSTSCLETHEKIAKSACSPVWLNVKFTPWVELDVLGYVKFDS